MAILLLCPAALADIPPTATPETQGFSTSTMIAVLGTATETDSLVWQGSNVNLDGNLSNSGNIILDRDTGSVALVPRLPVFNDLLGDAPGEVMYTVAYSENTVADQGLVSYAKSSALDTANQVVNTRNFENSKLLEFVGSETGRAVSSEDLVLDTAGAMDITSEVFTCPFAGESTDVTPQFCNIVEMGSDVDMTIMSLATTVSERNVAVTADVPVAADYGIGVTGFGEVPAQGSASASINAHMQEGSAIRWLSFNFETFGQADIYTFGKASDVQYSETTTASGDITMFSKLLSYQSGIRRT
jgi:hypothetical protein